MPRIAALALASLTACSTPHGLAAFERALAGQDSATAALTDWCRTRGIADPPQITARRLKAEIATPSPALRSQLGVGPEEPIRYRHVELRCGANVLSIAQNWYVASRLTPEMNAALASSDTPFGRVVAPLHFTRQRLESNRGQAAECPARTILSNRAVLKLADGTPISAVVECYTAANIAAARRSAR